MKNMAFKFLGNLLIVVHNKKAPTDEDSREYIAGLVHQDISRLRSIVFTQGGGPTATQRKEFNELIRGREYPIAVVSSDSMVRGIATAISWFNRKIKSFHPKDVEEAFRYLNIAPSDYETVWRQVKQLQKLVEN